MTEPTAVEHVYGRRTDDPANLALLNSLRYYHGGRFQVKDWSPEIHRHEVAARKRDREDRYIREHSRSPKPVVLVQKKEVFAHVPLSKSLGPLTHNEAFFKLTESSRPVQSVAHEILKAKADGVEKEARLARKQKSVPQLPKRLKTPDKTNRIDRKPVVDASNELEFYRIEGIEFLPEGFIELEPVLFHDEYRFGSDRDRGRFTEEQKKLVAARRAQYQQRHTKKMRQVTIFVVKDFLQNLDGFFEAWYGEHRRRMTQAEMEYLGKEMAVSVEAVEHMQEEFLEKKRRKNANTLNLYLQGRDPKAQERLERLPRFLQEYFYNINKQDYSHVKSKFMDVHYKPVKDTPAITKQTSDLTFRAPSFTNLATATRNSKFFENPDPRAVATAPTPPNLKITMEQIVNGTSTLKMKDFNVNAVEGISTAHSATASHPLTPTDPQSIDHLHALMEAFAKEKQAHTKHVARELPANCETLISKEFTLMNCKMTMQSPPDQPASDKKKFRGKGEGK